MTEKIDVSIIIPVKNGGELLERVLKSVKGQKTKYNYEIICIDSGSKDNSINIIKNNNIKLFQIKPEEFGHGKTRDFGASKGSGEFIIFITQDALPATDLWLENFINAMKTDEGIAGGFGIHYPYPDCNIIDKKDIENHFKDFGDSNMTFQVTDNEKYIKEEKYRHFLAFFSDNNACLRRSVWEKYPYDDVKFAEDQIWARKIIELRYKKLYCPSAPVYHSHNYNLKEYFKRYYDEYKGIYEIHKYIICKRLLFLFPAMIKHIINDIRYVIKLPTKIFEKINNIWYVSCREFCRYIGGYIGGNYHRFSKKKKIKMDKLFSLQREQIEY